MFTFLLVVHAIVAAALVGVILMQRSEGGGLAGGGSPAGLMSARGAANFLTRTTTVLAVVFVVLSIGMAALASYNRAPTTLDTSLTKPAANSPFIPEIPASAVPIGGDQSGTPAPAGSVAAPVIAPEAPDASAGAIPAPRNAAPTTPKAAELPKPSPAPRPVAESKAPAPAPTPKTDASAPIQVPGSLVSPPTPAATRPEPQPEGR